MGRFLRSLPLLALCACTSLRGKADELAEKGRFVEAAELYEQLVQDTPNDATLVSTRDDLRRNALDQLLGRARRLRFEGNDEQAEEHLERFLHYRTKWNAKLNGALESSLLDEVEGTQRHLRGLIVAPARKGLALTAEYAMERKRPLLLHPELTRVRREMEDVVLQGGKTTCARLKQVPAEGAPHWAELVSRYCRRWRESAPEQPPPPELLGAPTWTGAVQGTHPEQLEALRGRLSRAFEASPWYSPRSTQPVTFELKGFFTTQYDKEPVRLTAAWTDQEPYTHHEERTETYSEPYTEEETYKDEKGEQKKRTVTKYRTKERHYTVPVTRYRDVPRNFDYHALRHAVTYRFSVSSTGVLAERRSPLTVMVADTHAAQAYEHDVTFAPGGVRPSRPSFTPSEAWFSQKAGGLEQAFREQLTARWREYYCSAPALTLDEAARCARAGTELPAQAHKALLEVLGDDAARAHALFSPP
jgi:tetratricopeptide (TPR) repeat protein